MRVWGTENAPEIESNLLLESMIRFLVNKGVAINTQYNVAQPLLHLPVVRDDIDRVRLFVENNAVVDLQNQFGVPPLDLLVEKADADMAPFCTDKGADC